MAVLCYKEKEKSQIRPFPLRRRDKLMNMEIKKRIKKEHITYFVVAIIVALGGWYFMAFLSENSSASNEPVASVNGKEVTLEELNDEYYFFGATDMSKLQFLNDVVIPNKILLQEAKKRNIEATKDEADKLFNLLLDKRKVEKKALLQSLKTNGVTKRDVQEIMQKQVVLSKLVQEMFPGLSVSDKEVQEFYQENIQLFTGNGGKIIPLGEVEEKIKNLMLRVKREKAIRSYVTEVGTQSNIIMYDPEKLI